MSNLMEWMGITPDEPDTIVLPGPSETEKELEELQLEVLRKSLEEDPYQKNLLEKQAEYFESLTAKGELSDEELAEFQTEFELEKSALQEEYQMRLDRDSSTLYADLVSRGVDNTRTGRELQTNLTRGYGERFQQSIAELGTAKELAKSDMEAAKRQMALQGYKFAGDIQRFNLENNLAMATNAQNYMSNNRAMTANTALQNALLNQQQQQHAYLNRMGIATSVFNVGASMVRNG